MINAPIPRPIGPFFGTWPALWATRVTGSLAALEPKFDQSKANIHKDVPQHIKRRNGPAAQIRSSYLSHLDRIRSGGSPDG